MKYYYRIDNVDYDFEVKKTLIKDFIINASSSYITFFSVGVVDINLDPKFTHLTIRHNLLTHFTGHENLIALSCFDNKIKQINLNKSKNLLILQCDPIRNLDNYFKRRKLTIEVFN